MDGPIFPGNDRLELLQTFVRIVEAGSLSTAADQLGTSQPTVSRRLQALERALGLRLLQRSTHGIKLTDDGERCYTRGKELLEGWQALQADLRGARDEPRGALRVVVPHAFGQELLVAPLVDYLRRHPQVSVDWLLNDRRPDFIGDDIDCAIRVGAVEDPAVVALKLAEVERIVVVAPALLAGLGDADDVQLLHALPWLALRTFYRDEVVLARTGDGATLRIPIRPRMATDSLYALRSAALAGLGACIASAWVVEDDLARGRLVQLAPAWAAAPLPMYLVYPPARVQPARLRRFIDLVRAGIPGLSGAEAIGPGPG
ncbi:LysR family transcriptional regulator [Coralloluteibacterium stylophorae]|uniref:LysR family transcriptional regulator n=1 Tax=Coralloluteibacterium stylophorae TaxID=1776034 RepID=A0A8J8AW93_9GAMM|nr:LysR family transcriptional regulator [Coralloluteibacterium stylophorae]MBS7456913.1 LysR family transcriptional regulator [Coralloluteibacterium stylophorae]